jgi:hypothetical protein
MVLLRQLLDRAELKLRRYSLAAAWRFSLSAAAFGFVGFGKAPQAAEGGVPHGGEGSEVALLHDAEGFGVEAVVHLAAMLVCDNQARLAEDAEVTGDGGAADLREGGRELAGGHHVAAAEEIEDLAAGRVGEGFEDAGQHTVRLR